MKLDAMAYRADWDKLFQVTLSSSSILHVSWFAHSIAPDRVSQLFSFQSPTSDFWNPMGLVRCLASARKTSPWFWRAIWLCPGSEFDGLSS